MNKKLALLLIPLLMLPLVAFAYAHWSDTVYKKYKFRFGTVDIEILKWHVDKLVGWDTDCSGTPFDTEFVVTEIKDVTGVYTIGLEILADPIGPGYHLEFKMLVHNYGRLPVVIEAPILKISNLTTADPCFTDFDENMTDDYLGKYFDYTCQYYRLDDAYEPPDEDPNHYTTTVPATGKVYKPCESILIEQIIDFSKAQDYREDLQCHWFRLFVWITAENQDANDYGGSHTGPDGWYVG